MQEFVEGNRKVRLSTEAREETYGLVEATLHSQQYRNLSKGQKGIVRRFLVKVTGLSRAQMTRLVGALDETAVHPSKGSGEEAAVRVRGSIGTGSRGASCNGRLWFWQAGVAEFGRHFGVAHLQSPRLENLRECARAHDPHPSAPGVIGRADLPPWSQTGGAGTSAATRRTTTAPLYEKLGSPKKWQQYLKPGIPADLLARPSKQRGDTEAALYMQKAKQLELLAKCRSVPR